VVVLCLFFIDEPKFSTLLTAAEAALGIVGVWITLEIFRIGEAISTEQGTILAEQKKILEGQGSLIKEVHKTVLISAKFNHAQALRRQHDDARAANDELRLAHWDFVWRFETYHTLTLRLEPSGTATIRIVGVNNPSLKVELEGLENPIYTVDITEVRDNTDLHIGRAYCCCTNGHMQISRNANEIELLAPVVEFDILALGAMEARAVGRRPRNYVRLLDLEDPSTADQDRG
jgi:hypothetical protein